MIRKRNIVLLVILSIFMLAGIICGCFYGILSCVSKQTVANALSYYEDDNSYLTVTASIMQVEQVSEKYYRIYLQLDEQCSDFKFAEYFELLADNVGEAEEHAFNLVASDKIYKFVIGRKTIHNGSVPLTVFPIVAISEEDDSNVYLDFNVGKDNLLSTLKSMK